MNEVAWEERNHSIHPSQTRPSQHPGAGGASGPHAHPRRHANNQQSPQQQPIAEQILANGATNSAASDEMSSRGAAPQSATNNNHAGPRSQDDAMVGYFFQRPQTDPDFQNFSGGKRWALGDDSVIEVSITLFFGSQDTKILHLCSHVKMKRNSRRNFKLWR